MEVLRFLTKILPFLSKSLKNRMANVGCSYACQLSLGPLLADMCVTVESFWNGFLSFVAITVLHSILFHSRIYIFDK